MKTKKWGLFLTHRIDALKTYQQCVSCHPSNNNMRSRVVFLFLAIFKNFFFYYYYCLIPLYYSSIDRALCTATCTYTVARHAHYEESAPSPKTLRGLGERIYRYGGVRPARTIRTERLLFFSLVIVNWTHYNIGLHNITTAEWHIPLISPSYYYIFKSYRLYHVLRHHNMPTLPCARWPSTPIRRRADPRSWRPPRVSIICKQRTVNNITYNTYARVYIFNSNNNLTPHIIYVVLQLNSFRSHRSRRVLYAWRIHNIYILLRYVRV